ncbi:MAG: type I 3-dehydroquinate dehydratase, partial [Terriglobia bacterium]
MTKHPVLPRICIPATGRTAAELLDCARRALRFSRFVELRLDWIGNPAEALPGIPRLLADSGRRPRKAVVLLATCRRQPNGGRFTGTVAEQFDVLEKAAAAGCRLVDLEIESAEASGQDAVARLRTAALLVLSFHDFEKLPKLSPVVRRLRRFPADFYKLVGTATRQTDNCAILDSLNLTAEENGKGNWIAFCMGEGGVPSRILALSRGSRFVYAACPPQPTEPNHPSQTKELAAPGLLDWATLRDRYRAEKLTPQSALYGLLGCPVGHSIGAAIHNAAFRARGLDAVYIPLLANNLIDFRKAAERFPLAGFSVTIPHKQGILRWVDRTDRTARAAGAVNTVRVRRGRWEAINTDIEGIVAPLRRAFRLSEREPLPAGFRAVIVGNGGAARAAVIALQELRCRAIAITGRSPAKVSRFARDLGGKPLPMEQLERERFDLLVHTTPVGMWPRAGECVLRPEQVR